MAGGAPEAAGHYAITVVSAAYRRGFHAAVTSLTSTLDHIAARCAEAADHLHQVNQHLNAANEEARRFHTAIGHIGVQVQL